MTFHLLVGFGALCAGAVASVAGFGIGSLLTPTLGLRYGIKLAVAAVSIPHLLGSALRFAMIRRSLDRRVLLRFGLTSAAGGLTGALLHTVFSSPMLGVVLGALLIFAGGAGLTGLSRRMRFVGAGTWLAGALSGLFGGLVGNQGGIRSAALLGFELPKEAFVATATAVALLVDGARMPVYLVAQARALWEIWPAIAVAAGGVLLGTVFGKGLLAWIPEPTFRRVVSAIILALGIALVLGVGR